MLVNINTSLMGLLLKYAIGEGMLTFPKDLPGHAVLRGRHLNEQGECGRK